MPLTSGTRLGAYEITAQIGEGGMGEVYRATDRNLGREVAIKVLPDAFAQDAERLARFEREARTLASMNHPNIAIIHGFERADGVRALVMELVEGSTLADRVAGAPISLDEALPIARQIAEALEAAHEQGIVHRDLKPANVKVRDDGTVKVLDFGLAKMIGPPATYAADAATAPKEGGPYVPDVGAGFSRPTASMSPTITTPAITTPAMTQLGMILGTATYMSPEQAKGTREWPEKPHELVRRRQICFVHTRLANVGQPRYLGAAVEQRSNAFSVSERAFSGRRSAVLS